MLGTTSHNGARIATWSIETAGSSAANATTAMHKTTIDFRARDMGFICRAAFKARHTQTLKGPRYTILKIPVYRITVRKYSGRSIFVSRRISTMACRSVRESRT